MKITTLIEDDLQELKIVGTQMPQLQVAQAGNEAYIDLTRNQARALAEALIAHCNEADKNNRG